MKSLTGSSDFLIDVEKQESLLDSALKIVKNESFEMKRSLDQNELMDALKHAVQMICELRTSILMPKFYYRLYIDVTNELQHFLTFLTDRYLGEEQKFSVAELYETVQYTGNIVPRLYLLITVGVVYIKSGESPSTDILHDLVEMCKGVQHPLRGLFLRNYLLTSTKEFIPDKPPAISVLQNNKNNRNSINEDFGDEEENKLEEDETTSGDVRDAIDFIMVNFAEMNKLWVRMQHQGPSRESEKRERERRELRILVGTNLVRLSQLQNLELSLYRQVVLPGILEQSVSCREPISQEYLMECVIQVFPDNFHLSTLNEFLDACGELHSNVKIKNILGPLIEHLTSFAMAEECLPDDNNLFNLFSKHIDKMVESRSQMPFDEIISIQIALLSLALNCYRDRPELADTVYSTTIQIVERRNVQKFVNYYFLGIYIFFSILANSLIGRELTKLLKLPVENYNNIIELLALESYSNILKLLDLSGQRKIAAFIVENALENNTLIECEEHLDKLFSLIESLLIDTSTNDDIQHKTSLLTLNGGGQQNDETSHILNEQKDFDEQQILVSRLVHLIQSEQVEIHFKLLNKMRKVFGSGGSDRLRFTLPPTIYVAHKFILKIAEMKEQISAIISDRIDFDKTSEITYEFISKAFSVYEEEISESREQVQSLTLLIATITQIKSLVDESHEPLRNQCALYASKLLKRPDQAQMICLVARVFWYSKVSDLNGECKKDGLRTAECLKKATKIASQCMEELMQCSLFMHILIVKIHFFEENCLEVTRESIEELILRLREALVQMDPQFEVDQISEKLEIATERFKNLCRQRE
uniref:Vacuolar protein sorting-associated protein 35 n=1 Tax=Meloidogyne hapla TaxID=6305 RepID=A0A1I8AX68_MELHA